MRAPFQDIAHALSGGVSRASLQPLLAQLAGEAALIATHQHPQVTPIVRAAQAPSNLPSLLLRASQWRGEFSDLLVVGAGGSSLSGRMLTRLSRAPHAMRVHFLENVDPEAFDECLAGLPLAHTHVLAISKSGGTVETIAQIFALVRRLEEAFGASEIARRCTFITEAHLSPLRTLAERYGAPVLAHAPDIGGRFSVLTSVGLLPAAAAGLDIAQFCAGAASVVPQEQGHESAPALGAALQFAHMQRGKTLSVMLPYAERLSGFSAWFRQSWAESLGKNGLGTTPIRAVGSTDQHSQLQLYLGGPRDKFFTFIALNHAGKGAPITTERAPAPACLEGRTLGDVMQAEQQATLETLVAQGCPLRLFTFDAVDEFTLGALVMHMTLEITFMAKLLGVNAFDQPAVEEGKKRVMDYLARKGVA